MAYWALSPEPGALMWLLQNQADDWKLGSRGCYDAASLAKLQCKLELDFPSIAKVPTPPPHPRIPLPHYLVVLRLPALKLTPLLQSRISKCSERRDPNLVAIDHGRGPPDV